MTSQVLHTVGRNISDEAAGEIWNWSLVGVVGFFSSASVKSNQNFSSISKQTLEYLKNRCVSKFL